MSPERRLDQLRAVLIDFSRLEFSSVCDRLFDEYHDSPWCVSRERAALRLLLLMLMLRNSVTSHHSPHARPPDVISPVISFVNDRRSHFTFYSFSGRAAESIQRCLELAPPYPCFSAIQFRVGLSRLHNASLPYKLAQTCNTWTPFTCDRPFVF